MYETYTDGPAYCRVGAYMFSNQKGSYRVHDPLCIHYQGDDAVMAWSFYPVIVTSPYLRISSMLGLIDHEQEHTKSSEFPSARPVNDIWSGSDDALHYGSRIGVNDVVSYSGTDRSRSEKNVWHTSYRGNVRDTSSNPGLRVVPYYDGHFLRYAVTDTPHANTFRQTGVNSRGFMTFEMGSAGRNEVSSLFGGCYDLYEAFKAYHSYWHDNPDPILINSTWDWNYWVQGFTNSSFKEGNRICFRADYKCIINDALNETIATFQVHQSFDVSFVPSYGTNLAANPNRIRLSSVHVDNFSTVKALTPTLYHGVTAVGPADDSVPISWGVQNWSDGSPTDGEDAGSVYPLSYIAQTGSEPISNLQRFAMNGEGYTLARHMQHERIFRELMHELRPSSYIASSDAIDKQILLIKTNLLQNLQHLKDVVSLLPDVSGLSKVIAKAIRGDPSALKEAIDWLTDAILKFRFEQKPTADAAREVATANALEGLRLLSKKNQFTAYGQFKYTVPDWQRPFPDGRWVLETRSKLRMHIDLNTLMVAYLMGNSVGLLPTLERIWQLVPFTFVVDWIFGISKRLHLVQNQLNFIAMRTEFAVYSYTLTYYPSAELLADWGLASDSGEPFGIRCYRRELSYWKPTIKESKFDFLKPTNSPDLITVGSLLWQVIT